MAGVMVVVAAFAGVGRFLAYIPWPVVEGFTIGIAVDHLPAAGARPRSACPSPTGENTAAVAVRAVGDAFGGEGNWSSLLLVLLVAVIMVGAVRLHRALPGSLLAVVVAVGRSPASPA